MLTMRLIRTFIAIDIPYEIRDKLSALQMDLKKVKARVSWPKVENIHITLKFLGDVEANQITDIAQAVQIATNEMNSFMVEIREVGAFPNWRKARILWVGARSDENLLAELARRIDMETTRLGYGREERPFKAHLTLGRVKMIQDLGELMKKVEDHRDFKAGVFPVTEVIVMQSELNSLGSIYTPLHRIQIQN